MTRQREGARSALLVGDPDLLWPVVPILAKSGFSIDAVTLGGTRLQHSRQLREVAIVDSLEGAVTYAASVSRIGAYDWISVGDDESLRLARTHPDLTSEARLRIAPVTDAGHLGHLGSKVALAQRLSVLSVLSPRFRLARSSAEAVAAAEEFGGRSLLKPDFGSGGAGIMLAEDPTAAAVCWHLRAVREVHGHKHSESPPPQVLVQEHVEGLLVDVSGIFWNGQLIHYTYAHISNPANGFGASVVRHYYPTSAASPAIVDELNVIGIGLGLHGFANITCVETPDGNNRHYFEVDARPNLWASFGAEFGDDPVTRLRLWFDEGRVSLPAKTPAGDTQAPARSSFGPTSSAMKPRNRKVSMFKRLSRMALLRNRYGVWRDVPWGSPEGRRLLQRKLVRG